MAAYAPRWTPEQKREAQRRYDEALALAIRTLAPPTENGYASHAAGEVHVLVPLQCGTSCGLILTIEHGGSIRGGDFAPSAWAAIAGRNGNDRDYKEG